MIAPRQVRLTVNGVAHEALVEPRRTLADFLRGDLGLGGTHIGCEHGVCGACTVLVDGKSARSCLMLAVQADGADVTTIEGLSQGHELHPIQQAFVEKHGLQCGFCTPGFILTVKELLDNSPEPSEEEIMDALGGQICRCTGYQHIREAVDLAIQRASLRSDPLERVPHVSEAVDLLAQKARDAKRAGSI